MKRTIIALTLLLTSTAYAADDDTVYVIPQAPDEAVKVEALKMAYILNKYSMVGRPIDMTGPVKCLLLQPSSVGIDQRRDLCLNAR
jgi:hypothetical protein